MKTYLFLEPSDHSECHSYRKTRSFPFPIPYELVELQPKMKKNSISGEFLSLKQKLTVWR